MSLSKCWSKTDQTTFLVTFGFALNFLGSNTRGYSFIMALLLNSIQIQSCQLPTLLNTIKFRSVWLFETAKGQLFSMEIKRNIQSEEKNQHSMTGKANGGQEIVKEKDCDPKHPGEKKYSKKKTFLLPELFRVDEEYDLNRVIGKGVYGVVAAGVNLLTQKQVAVKKLINIFQNPDHSKRILREIKILSFLNHKNIVSLLDLLSIQDQSAYNEVYLCMDYMSFDLRRLIRSQQRLDEKKIKHIMFQLLHGVYYMHSAGIIHRDIKPENILISNNLNLKVADMNLARNEYSQDKLTGYVSSRPYRAPQIFISCREYTKAIDIWSIGCIFFQLMSKTVLFQAKDYLRQIKKFIAVLGKPKLEMFKSIGSLHSNSAALQQFFAQIPDRARTNWKQLLPNASVEAIHLLDNMLTYDSNVRFTAEQCLDHPYLQCYRKQPRIKCNRQFDFSFEKLEMKESVLRKTICQQIEAFRLKMVINSKCKKEGKITQYMDKTERISKEQQQINQNNNKNAKESKQSAKSAQSWQDRQSLQSFCGQARKRIKQ